MENENPKNTPQGGYREKLRTITLEEHFGSPAYMDTPGRREGMSTMAYRPGFEHFVENLGDLGEGRIAQMDAAGIDMQVLSHTAARGPGEDEMLADPQEAINTATEANEFLAAAVKQYPDRFGGFATLPTPIPEAAADELERTVKEYGFKGAFINGHTGSRYLDDKFFWPILERAESLRVPIYIHPTPPPQPVIDAYYSGFSPEVIFGFSTNGWGWHIETAVHVLRMILGGVFDQFPDLQIIIGHLGEALPFMLPRLDRNMGQAMTKLNRSIGAYLRENLYYTFSGFNFIPTFLDLFMQVGADRIMFSADYPYSSMAEARAFLDRLPVSTADRHKIAHGNAELLMGL
jgi:hypothetical protein